jgi:hypothetical protein
VEIHAKRRLVLAVAAVVGGMTGVASAQQTLFSENFDGLTLGPFVSPTETGGNGSDWTDVPPAGWTRDNSGVPEGPPPEFRGFTFMNKDSWVATEGNQERFLFSSGTGTVMVADPDAFDDGTDIDPNLFRALVTTPAIPLAGVSPNTLVLNLNSSFRPYDGMTARVAVRFDNGSFNNILEYTTANSGGDSNLMRVDETLALNVANPAGAGNVQFRFEMAEAGNDWWWAVDNIQVTTIPEPSSAALLGFGLAALARRARNRRVP